MRNTSPVGWRVTRYDYINRQIHNLGVGSTVFFMEPPNNEILENESTDISIEKK